MICYCQSQQADGTLQGLVHIQQRGLAGRGVAGVWEEVSRWSWGWGPGNHAGAPEGFHSVSPLLCFHLCIWLIKCLKSSF